jgi:ACS family D-galactonate transporter-like MFS transporter
MRRWIVVGLIFFGILISYVDRGNLAIAAPLIMREFNLSPTSMGTLLSSFFWTYAVFQIPSGYLVDRFGIRAVYGAAFLVWSLASAGVGLAQNAGQILALRLALGLAESVGPLASIAYIKRNFEENRQGLPTAIYVSGLTMGPAVGALLGGALLQWQGWRSLFLLTGLAGCLWLPFWFLFGPRDPVPAKASPLREKPRMPALAPLLRSPVFWAMTISIFLYSYFWFFVLTWIPSYLIISRGMSHLKMGVALGTPLLLMSAVSLAAGALSDLLVRRTGATLAVRKGFICSGFCIGSSLLLLLTPAGGGSVTGVFFLSLAGIGIGGGNFWALAQMTAPAEATGRVIGYLNTVAQVAGASAPVVTGWLLGPERNFTSGIVIAGCCPALAAFVILALVRERGLLHFESVFAPDPRVSPCA